MKKAMPPKKSFRLVLSRVTGCWTSCVVGWDAAGLEEEGDECDGWFEEAFPCGSDLESEPQPKRETIVGSG